MSLHEGCPRQPGFARSNLDHGSSFWSFATEWNDQDGVPAVVEISLVERNDQYPVANRRITQIRGPNLPPARQWVTRQN
jgi:hypothetical protein